MAHMVFCVRNKKEMEGLDEPPFDSEFGQKIYKNVSKAAWAEWVDRQKMLLNEYRLQPWTPAGAAVSCGADGAVLLWRRFGAAAGVRSAISLTRPRVSSLSPMHSIVLGIPLDDHHLFISLKRQHSRTPRWCKLNQNPMGRLTRAGSIVSGRGSAW